MTKNSWITVGVGVLALAIACALAWWAYRETQKRELQQHVVALAQDSTARLREALGLLTAGAEARAKLETHFAALEGNVKKTQALDASIYPALVEAAEAYATDVHALLRRELALHAGRDAVHVDIGAINNHLSAAGTRSPEWISQALALHQRLDKSYLDYRLAAGGLEKSLRSLRDTSLRLRTFVPATVVIEEDPIISAEKRLVETSTQIEQQVETARRLPTG
jgi:uncharacterized protein YfaS (alpha-2-macroglobulin family)